MPMIKTERGSFWIADHRRESTGIATVFIHGAGGSHLSLPAELRTHDLLNPILVNLSGHGKSPGAGHDRIADFALDIVALLDALNIDTSLILGHSMGGAIVQWLALHHADRTAGIVLLGTGAQLPVNPALISGIVKEPLATIDNIVRWIWSKGAPEELMQESAEIMRQTDPAVIQNDLIACDSFDVLGRLTEITVPALIIAGENDKMTPVSRSLELARGIADSTLVVIPGAGHMMMMEQPMLTADAIEDWFNRLS